MRRLVFYTLLVAGLISSSFSQNTECGTTISQKEIDYINSTLSERISAGVAHAPANETEKFIAITAHIVRQSDGTGGLNENQLTDAIEYLNESYELLNMTFFLIGDINYIDSDNFYDFDASQEAAITSVNNVANTINIYFYNSLSSGNSALCGYAYFPSTGRDHVMMANGCTVNRGSTLPHEIGHYFNLYHTHGKSNTGTTDELVDGSNCSNAGDDLCDTAADPNLSGKVDGGCGYTGSNRDANGDLFSPNPRNFMSYAPGQCRELFSAGQAGRMVDAYETFKTYLIDKYYAADFTARSRRVCEGESIQFIDESIAASSLEWEFPGGSPATSTDKFPIVSYASAGNYDVTLRIQTEIGDAETKILSNYVTVVGNVTGVSSASGSFEDANLAEEIINDDLGITFEQTNSASSEGSNSVKIDFGNYSTIGAEDYLIADKMNSSSNKQFQLSFDYAYARYDDEFSDGLAVVIKNDCGDWFEVWKKTGTDLATAEDHTTSFIPLANEWQSVSLTIQIPDDYNNTEIAFKGINGFGNSLYIDNYSITPTSAAFSIESIAATNASCSDTEDGSISITTSGASNLEYSIDGETFQSSNTFSNLVPGDYIVSVRENGLADIVVAIGAIGPDPISYTSNVVNPICSAESSGSVQFLTEGGTGALEINFDDQGFSDVFTYENLASGTYSFQIQDENGCVQVGSVNITAANQSPTIPVISPFLTLLSIEVDDDIAGIQWYLNGEAIVDATRTTLANPVSGEYTVEVSNEFCTSVSDVYLVLAADEIRSNLIVAPNPVDDILTLQIPNSLEESVEIIQILDLTGKVISENTYTSELDVSTLNAGIYVLSLSATDGVVTRRFIKQ